jgi:glutathione peroxidase-family protein
MLQSMCGPTSETFEDTSMLYYDPKTVSDVRWNFEVFLISKTGRPLYRYSSDTPVSDIETDIKVLLRQSVERPIVERYL